MTSCDLCGNPSSTPVCQKCEAETERLGAYPVWANGSGLDRTDRHRNRVLGTARADLVALPELLDQLTRCLTERGESVGGGGKVTGSAAPLRLDVLHLADDRKKPGWEGTDPRLPLWALTWYDKTYVDRNGARRGHEKTAHTALYPTEEAAWDACDGLTQSQQDYAKVEPWRARDQYGILGTLESWTRVVWEEMPRHERPEMAEVATVRTECSILIEVWDWIEEQQWAEELGEDVSRLTNQVRAGLGIRPEYKPRCRYCRNAVIPVDDGHKLTAWETCAYGLCLGCKMTYPPGPALAALAQVQAPMKLRAISDLVEVPLRTLQRWVTDGVVKPAPDSEGKRRGRLFDLAEVREVANRTHGRMTA